MPAQVLAGVLADLELVQVDVSGKEVLRKQLPQRFVSAFDFQVQVGLKRFHLWLTQVSLCSDIG